MSMPARRQVTIAIGGVTYHVEIGDLSTSPVEVIVNGEPFTVHVGEDGTVPTSGARREPVPLEPERTSPPEPAPRMSSDSATAREIRSPMPGDIVDIQVQAGDEVQVGQQLCALDAMKMKSAIRSGRDGVIASVEVSEGQPVSHGDVLVTFE
ncbi:MAG: biotin/lipoyl-containing protein [Anaerolineales bacterium]